MRVAYIGNFGPPHSTENHVARALEHNGHDVLRLQENFVDNWQISARAGDGLAAYDFFLWTRTGWDWPSLGISHDEARQLQMRFLLNAHRAGVPVVGYHLDIWWGLKRQHLIFEEPFFQVDLLITADGGHDTEWVEAGVNHVWFPPGVSLAETEPGMFRSDLASPLAFVGSHDGGYHPESEHRHELVRWLKENFRRDCAFWPRPGEHALRGAGLRDLYASTQVNIGDSCFVGTGLKNYWSDRIPETLGRGGFLLHPETPGLEAHFIPDVHLWTWRPYDWDHLHAKIKAALEEPAWRADTQAAAREHVRRHHTYEVRMEQLVELLYARKLLKRPRKGSTHGT